MVDSAGTRTVAEMTSPVVPGMYLGGAFAFVFNQRDEMLLLRERDSKRKYMWDLPGGTLVTDEQPLVGLRREVLEETGLTIAISSPLCHLKWDRHESGHPILVAFYLAEVASGQVRLSGEHIGHRWMDQETMRREDVVLPPGREATAAMLALRSHLRGA